MKQEQKLYFPIVITLEFSYGMTQWTAEHPTLTGCCTWGETPRKALEQLWDARRGWIRVANKLGVKYQASLLRPEILVKYKNGVIGKLGREGFDLGLRPEELGREE